MSILLNKHVVVIFHHSNCNEKRNTTSQMSWCLNLYTPAISSLVYAHMYFRAKCLLKVFFLFIPIWNIIVMRKKGIAFF